MTHLPTTVRFGLDRSRPHRHPPRHDAGAPPREAELVVVADPQEGAAGRSASPRRRGDSTDPQALIDDPRVEAVAITCASTAHADLVVAAAEAGKAVFVEKPMAMTLADADRAIAACRERRRAPPGGVQPAFRRRLRRRPRDRRRRRHRHAPAAAVADPRPRARRPGAACRHGRSSRRPSSTTSTPSTGSTRAPRRSRSPSWPTRSSRPTSGTPGLLDTAVVTIRYDNGAIAVAEASFSAAYGYDVRGEVFGSAGMVTAGSPAHLSTAHWSAAGVSRPTRPRRHRALHRRVCRRARRLLRRRPRGQPTPVGGEDARAALRIALACIESVETGGTRSRPRHRPGRGADERGDRGAAPSLWRSAPRWSSSTCPWPSGCVGSRAGLPGRDLGLDPPRHRRARGPARGGRRLLVDDRLHPRAAHRCRGRRRAARDRGRVDARGEAARHPAAQPPRNGPRRPGPARPARAGHDRARCG